MVYRHGGGAVRRDCAPHRCSRGRVRQSWRGVDLPDQRPAVPKSRTWAVAKLPGLGCGLPVRGLMMHGMNWKRRTKDKGQGSIADPAPAHRTEQIAENHGDPRHLAPLVWPIV